MGREYGVHGAPAGWLELGHVTPSVWSVLGGHARETGRRIKINSPRYARYHNAGGVSICVLDRF